MAKHGDERSGNLVCSFCGKSQDEVRKLIAGPTVYSFKQLMELVLSATDRKCLLLPIPFWVASTKALFLELLPKPLLTRDQVALLKSDNVLSGAAPTLDTLGITPTAAELIVPTYLDRFRRGGRFHGAQTA